MDVVSTKLQLCLSRYMHIRMYIGNAYFLLYVNSFLNQVRAADMPGFLKLLLSATSVFVFVCVCVCVCPRGYK